MAAVLVGSNILGAPRNPGDARNSHASAAERQLTHASQLS
jgi:hypothetical protein